MPGNLSGWRASGGGAAPVLACGQEGVRGVEGSFQTEITVQSLTAPQNVAVSCRPPYRFSDPFFSNPSTHSLCGPRPVSPAGCVWALWWPCGWWVGEVPGGACCCCTTRGTQRNPCTESFLRTNLRSEGGGTQHICRHSAAPGGGPAPPAGTGTAGTAGRGKLPRGAKRSTK